jgi:hypothetical protein
MEKSHTYNNVNTALDFINNPRDSESKLAFETAMGDMGNEPYFEWTEDLLYNTQY